MATADSGAAFSDWRPFFDPEVIGYVQDQQRRLSQEEQLMLAVVEKAIAEFRATTPRLKAEAYWYLASDEEEWPFAFRAVCEHFRLPAEKIRRRIGVTNGLDAKLRRLYPDPHPTKDAIVAVMGRRREAWRITEIMRFFRGVDSNYVYHLICELMDEGRVEKVTWGLFQATHTQRDAA